MGKSQKQSRGQNKALQFVSLDIETTGFAISDEVTVIGFVLPLGCRVFCQVPDGIATGSDDPEGGMEATERGEADVFSSSETALETRLQEQADIHLNLSLHDSEVALLEAVGDFATQRLQGDDVLLVAFNGETYSGGFDLPFLRTRLARTGVSWPFADLPYADLMPVVTNLFNTTITAPECAGGDDEEKDTDDSVQVAALPEVYEVLVGGEAGDLDPFADSADAVRAYRMGDLDSLVAHNLSDIIRTQEIGELTQAYCSKSDFRLKSLTPTAEAFDGDANTGDLRRDGGRDPC